MKKIFADDFYQPYSTTPISQTSHETQYPMPIKEEPTQTFNTFRYQNQQYSNLDCAADNSLSPSSSINHHLNAYELGFNHHVNDQRSNRNETVKKVCFDLLLPDGSAWIFKSLFLPQEKKQDSPALRALLNKPTCEKITYDYKELKKSSVNSNASDVYEKNFHNQAKSVSDSSYEAEAQKNVFPWMKSNSGKV